MCFCERQTITESSGQGGQVTIHGHATGRDQRYEMRAAQGGSGDVNYFQTSICYIYYIGRGGARYSSARGHCELLAPPPPPPPITTHKTVNG